jgi:hypothetical protein
MSSSSSLDPFSGPALRIEPIELTALPYGFAGGCALRIDFNSHAFWEYYMKPSVDTQDKGTHNGS